jgi:hypothetical protein
MHPYVYASRFAKDGCTSAPSAGLGAFAYGVGDQSG